MPAFDLPATELDALVAFVESLNSPAAGSSVPGDPVAGEQFFLGRGQCASCHMIRGRGAAVGPDLSDVGREMTVDEIRTALLHPGAQIAPGYDLVTVKLRDGHTVRGFVRARSGFDMQLQDLEGHFRSLAPDEIAEIQDERQSLHAVRQGKPRRNSAT